MTDRGQNTQATSPTRLQRVPPNDPHLEANLLGAALLDTRAAELVASLDTDTFYDNNRRGLIAQAIAELRAANKPTDAGTVASHLHTQGLLEQTGGHVHLAELIGDCPTTGTSSTTTWAETLTLLAHKRRQLHLAHELVEAVYRGVPTTGLAHQIGQEAEAAAAAIINSWEPVNLAGVLAGDQPVITPNLLSRTDGICLLYPGQVHALNAEPEAGKSWVALLACLQQIHQSNHVLYYDLEDNAGEIVARLLHLGATPTDILDYFHYIRPDDPLDPTATAKAAALAQTHQPTLAVIDGVTEAIVSMGGSIKDNDDIARFLAALPRPLARNGAAVLILDHVVKDKDTRGRWGIGGQHKLAGIDGGSYTLEIVTPFAIGKPGSSRLIINKDRHGQVRCHATTHGPNQLAGTVKFDSQPGGHIDVTITPADQPEHTWAGPTHCQDAILELLSGMPGEAVSVNQIAPRLRAKGNSFRRETISTSLEILADTGRLTVRTGPRNARMYSYEVTQDDQIF